MKILISSVEKQKTVTKAFKIDSAIGNRFPCLIYAWRNDLKSHYLSKNCQRHN